MSRGWLTEDVDLEDLAVLLGEEADGLQGEVLVDSPNMAEERDGRGTGNRSSHVTREGGE